MKYLVWMAAIFSVDLTIKNKVEKNQPYGVQKEIGKGFLLLRKVYNKGAMLHFLENKGKIVKVVSLILFLFLWLPFILILSKEGRVLEKIGLSSLLGGAASNLYDRLRRGYVIDYFSFSFLKKIIFNLGDIFIFFGVILLTVAQWNQERE